MIQTFASLIMLKQTNYNVYAYKQQNVQVSF
jgi:hypothetical protein